MCRIVRQTFPRARKDYPCDACTWARYVLNDGVFSFKDYRSLVKAKQNGYKIKKGQLYLNQVNFENGRLTIFRAIPEIDEICMEKELYDYD